MWHVNYVLIKILLKTISRTIYVLTCAWHILGSPQIFLKECVNKILYFEIISDLFPQPVSPVAQRVPPAAVIQCSGQG